MKLTIDRKRWARGSSSCLLYRDSRKMCCLGFYGLALGYTEDDICEIPDPAEQLRALFGMGLQDEKNLWPRWLSYIDYDEFDEYYEVRRSHIFNALVHVNDAPDMIDAEREKRLTELFARNGVEVEFVG